MMCKVILPGADTPTRREMQGIIVKQKRLRGAPAAVVNLYNRIYYSTGRRGKTNAATKPDRMLREWMPNRPK